MLRPWRVVHADGTSVTNEYYYPAGQIKRCYGSRTYPEGYGYDAQGRMTKMTNWTSFAASSGARVTTWNYDGYRGFLTNKTYDGGAAGPSYTHTAAGRLLTRAWARGITATNSYNTLGNLSGVNYSDGSTPNLSYGYDRLGRQNAITNGTAGTTLVFNDASQLLSESYSGGTLGGLSVTNGYDALQRRTGLSALNSSTPLLQHSFAFDNASWLTNVTDGTFSAGYTYLANSPLISQITFKSNSTVRMTTTKNYDYLHRLLSISSAPSASGQLPLYYSYAYNNANQRTRVALNDGSFWVYQYDPLGQVTSGKKYWADGTPVSGQQFEYGFDDIGNRTSTKAGGDQSGAGLRPASYSANSLNQYTNRTVPNAFDVIGIANASSSVTVNSSSADYRRGEYFQELVSVNNSSTSVWQNVSVTTSGGGTNSGNVFVPTATETFDYDADRNMTNDGRWNFTWDAENRLVNMTSLSTGPSNSKRKLNFVYDHKGRRIQKIISTWNGSAYVAQSTNKFVYEGWNLIAELNGTNGVIRSYIWGLDVSGSIQGAGGVGGLLAIKPSIGNPSFAAYDGNGNVTGLIDATTGTTSGNFEYGPFGETIRLTPNSNNQSVFRFSTKYTDDDSDILYYGFRYYDPSTGCWLNRDPAGEAVGGINLYGFARNWPVGGHDYLGLAFRWVSPVYEYLDLREDPRHRGFGIGGYTQWDYFSPEPRVWNHPALTGCQCGKKQITVFGSLRVKAGWVKGDEESRKHEMIHVYGHYYRAYEVFKQDAESYEGICMCEAKAKCIADMIKKEMRDAYFSQARAMGLQYDCEDYGKRYPALGVCRAANYWISKYMGDLIMLSRAKERCDQYQF